MADKIKNIFVNKNKLFLIILAIFCSILLWVYVTNQEGKVNEVSFSGIKVVLEGKDSNADDFLKKQQEIDNKLLDNGTIKGNQYLFKAWIQKVSASPSAALPEFSQSSVHLI